MNCMQFNETDQQVKLEFKDVSYFSSGEGGNVSAAIAEHNSATDAHSDIRLLIQGLSERLSALADSDDTTLDQLSEIVAYIKSNRDLISAITTNKVSVSDIVDNLTTNVVNKPLSAAQGVALKALIDAITVPDKLPNPNALTFTGAVTGSYDGSAPVSVEIPSGGGGSGSDISLGLTGATVGQIAKITAVDDTGKPTAWEPVDMPSGGGNEREWVKIGELTTAEDTTKPMYIEFTKDVNGDLLSLKGVLVIGRALFSDTKTHMCALICNDTLGSNANYLMYAPVLRNGQPFTIYSEFLRVDGVNSVAFIAFNSGNVKQNGGCGNTLNTWSPSAVSNMQFPMRGIKLSIFDSGLLAGSKFEFWGVKA